MGTVSNAALENGGEVFGVIPKFLNSKEIEHTGLTKLYTCKTMHERKTKMFELSEGFIALPGGFGTLEEISEILTWGQLGLHQYPMGLLNVNSYYKHFESLLDSMTEKELLKTENREMLLINDNISDLLTAMQSYQAPEIPKWINKDEL